MTVAERVEFCERCFGAFDVPVGSRQSVCDECRLARKRVYNARRNPPKRRPTWVPARLQPPEPWMVRRKQAGFSYASIAREAGISKSSLVRRFKQRS